MHDIEYKDKNNYPIDYEPKVLQTLLGDNAIYFTNNASYAHDKGTEASGTYQFKKIHYQVLSAVITGLVEDFSKDMGGPTIELSRPSIVDAKNIRQAVQNPGDPGYIKDHEYKTGWYDSNMMQPEIVYKNYAQSNPRATDPSEFVDSDEEAKGNGKSTNLYI